MIFKAQRNEILQVDNPFNENRVVVLLPVTRVTPKAMNNWENIIKIIETSKIACLVILDKTPNEEASAFFESHKLDSNSVVHIIRRPPNEPIYDSQKFVQIAKKLWIIQLHDDDEWRGILFLPDGALELDLFTTEFYFESNSPQSRVSWGNSPPARINFTLLPSRIWNKFSKFIDDQGGHVAGSVDATLDFIARASCTINHLFEFEYIYNNRHWKNRREASKNLSVLAAQDGWSYMASVDIQLLNRSIDQITSIEYFVEDLPPLNLEMLRKKSFENLKLSSKRRIFLHLKLVVYNFLNRSLKYPKKICHGTRIAAFIKRIESLAFTNKFILNCSSSQDVSELKNQIRILREKGDLSSLSNRFIFWEKYLN